MPQHSAIGACTARSDAGVNALVVVARQLDRAVAVGNTLWPARNVRIAKVALDAGARSGADRVQAVGVGAAGRR
jgi:hypothetical protein